MPLTPQYRNLYGIILMLLHSLALPMLYSINKYLMRSLSSSQVVFLYKFAVLIGILPWIFWGGLKCLKTNRFKLHLMRGFVSTIGALMFMFGLKNVDVASAAAINKMEPILVMVVASVYFKEQLNKEKIITIVLSFIGMLLTAYQFIDFAEGKIFFPWLNSNTEIPPFNFHYLILFGAVILWTANSSIVKSLGKTESNRTQLFYISLISVIISMPAALFRWQWENMGYISLPIFDGIVSITDLNLTNAIVELVLLSAFMHFLHVVCYFQSLKVAEMSVVIPFDYSRLIFGAILGYYFFNEKPTFSAFIGYGLILGSGLFLIRKTTSIKQK